MEFSRRKRITETYQNATDLVRAAVGWNDVFGDPVRHSGLPPACADQPAWYHAQHNGRSVGTTPRTGSRSA
jgi:hypothetical protein